MSVPEVLVVSRTGDTKRQVRVGVFWLIRSPLADDRLRAGERKVLLRGQPIDDESGIPAAWKTLHQVAPPAVGLSFVVCALHDAVEPVQKTSCRAPRGVALDHVHE